MTDEFSVLQLKKRKIRQVTRFRICLCLCSFFSCPSAFQIVDERKITSYPLTEDFVFTFFNQIKSQSCSSIVLKEQNWWQMKNKNKKNKQKQWHLHKVKARQVKITTHLVFWHIPYFVLCLFRWLSEQSHILSFHWHVFTTI